MNQVVLIGRLTIDPVLNFIQNSSRAVARFSIAVNREFSKEKEADFFNIVVWGKPAESVASHLNKGRLVAINGSARNNNYEDKNGVKHYNIEIVANKVEFLDYKSKPDNQNNTNQNQRTQQSKTQNQNQSNQVYNGNLEGFMPIDGDDDIPF